MMVWTSWLVLVVSGPFATGDSLDSNDRALATDVEAPATTRDPNPFQGHLLDGSGYLLPRGRWQIGLLDTGYGIFDQLNVTTSPYPWILAPLLEGFSVNLGIKVGFGGPTLAPSLEARYVYLDIRQTEESRSELTETRVSAHIVPVTAALTFAPDAIQAYSLAARYTVVEIGASESRQSQEVTEGAAGADQFHMILSGRWRFTSVVGLYVRGNIAPWLQNLNVEGETNPDDQSTVSVTGSFDTTDDVPWSALGGVHLIFGNVNVRVGMGYGNYFAPVLGLTLPDQSVFPDFDLYVRL